MDELGNNQKGSADLFYYYIVQVLQYHLILWRRHRHVSLIALRSEKAWYDCVIVIIQSVCFSSAQLKSQHTNRYSHTHILLE